MNGNETQNRGAQPRTWAGPKAGAGVCAQRFGETARPKLSRHNKKPQTSQGTQPQQTSRSIIHNHVHLFLSGCANVLISVFLPHFLHFFSFYSQVATAISAHGCWSYSKKSLGKTDEYGDVENRDLSTSISGERKNDEIDKMASYYEQIANEKRAAFWGRCMQIIYQV